MFDLIKFNYEKNYGHILTAVLLLAAFWLMLPLVGTDWNTPMMAVWPATVYIFCVTLDKYIAARVANLDKSAWKVVTDVDPDPDL